MSHSKGIVGALILSSLLLSPLAMAEESQTFAAMNEARHAAFEQHETELAMQAKDQLKTQQASAAQAQTESANHS
ncbi:MAG: hypothetical protein ACOH2R_25790 [Pseudomonas sp.]